MKFRPVTNFLDPNYRTMLKTTLFLLTTLIVCTSWDLPIVNEACAKEGKFIKADHFCLHNICPPDSNKTIIVPEVQFSAKEGSYEINTVVIDPGHGGHDPGCLGPHSREKHLALAIGKYLAEGLRQVYPELRVIMTRSTDVFVPLHERASIATRNQADLFISIHCNAFSGQNARGTETYVLGLHATEENLKVAKRENEAILLEENYQETYGYDPNSPEAHITLSMFQNAFLEQSISFAEKVQSQVKVKTALKDRGVKQAGFLVLRYATMPSVLVEAGFLTNSYDESYLLTTKGQQKMAESILNAFINYKNEMENQGQQEVATVAYLEVEAPKAKNNPPVTKNNPAATNSRRSNLKSNAKENTAQSNYKPYGLEIAPPSKPMPTKTNTSPSKTNKKIVANQPVTTFSTPSSTISTENTEPEKKDNLIFCVQLAASPKKLNLNGGKWSNVDQTIEVVKESNLYKYQVRNFATQEEAEKVKSSLRSQGFSDAFVIAYLNGQRVDPRKLK